MEPTAGGKLRVSVIKCCNLLLQRQVVSWLHERPGFCNNVACIGFLSSEETLKRSGVLGEIIKGYFQLQLYIAWRALVEMQYKRLYTWNIPWLPVNRITMEAQTGVPKDLAGPAMQDFLPAPLSWGLKVKELLFLNRQQQSWFTHLNIMLTKQINPSLFLHYPA